MTIRNLQGKDVLNNYIYNASYQLFSMLVPLLTTPYISRILGAEEIGRYAYDYSVASYFVLLVMLGLKNYGNRMIAISRDDRKELSDSFSNIYLMQLLSCLIVTILYVTYASFYSKKDSIAWILLLLIIASGIDISWFFSGLEEFKTIATRDFLIKIATTISIFIFVNDNNDLWKYTLILSLGALFSQILLWCRLRKYVDFVKPSLREAWRHVKPNIILFIPIVSVNFYKTMDKLMLGIMCDSAEVGYYYSSEKVISVPLAMVSSLNTVMLPHMSYYYSSEADDEGGRATLFKSLLIALFISGVMCSSIMSVSKEFVPFFYGTGFEKCIELFYILLPNGIIIAYTNVVCSQFLIPKDLKKVYVLARVVGALVNLLFNYVFIKIWMSIGAAIATCITEVFVCLVQMFATRREIPIKRMTCATIIQFFFSVGIAFMVRQICFFDNVYFNMTLKIAVVFAIYICEFFCYWYGVKVRGNA